MHDPDVVAFDIPRPWPLRNSLSGRRYWPAMVTVWHREPGGADALTVCRHWIRNADGSVKRSSRAWKWHVHHWRIQVRPLQMLRRRMVTRCAWCGGRDTKANPCDTGGSWYPPKSHWWQSERDVYHGACYSKRLDAARSQAKA